MIRPTFLRRIGALLIDYALILGWMAVLAIGTLVFTALTSEVPNWLEHGTGVAQLMGFVLLVLPVGIYLFVCEAGPRQATIGKRALGLRVVTSGSGDRPGRGRILLRTVVKLLPWELAHFFVWQMMAVVLSGGTEFSPGLLAGLIVVDVLPLIYIAVVAFEPQRRGPHDLIARTRVVSGRTHAAGA